MENTELTPNQQAKEEAKAKKYWNTMVSRKEAYEMVNGATNALSQQLQLLMIQNRTLLEILGKKGIATEEEINEHSKEVIESIFGVPEDGKGEGTSEE